MEPPTTRIEWVRFTENSKMGVIRGIRRIVVTILPATPAPSGPMKRKRKSTQRMGRMVH